MATSGEGGGLSLDELHGALELIGVGAWSWREGSSEVELSATARGILGLEGPLQGTWEALVQLCVAEDQEALRANLDAIVRGEGGALCAQCRVQVDSELRWVVVSAQPAASGAGLLGTLRDVTSEKRTAEDLRTNGRLLRMSAELATDYVYEVNLARPSLAPSIVAGSFERTTGYTPDEVAAKGGWKEIIHPGDSAFAEETQAQLFRGTSLVAEYRILDARGEVRWLRDRIHPVADPTTGEITTLIGGVSEITKEKRLQEQLAHAQKLEALARLAGSVAHDFNNLLTVVLGSVSLARDASDDLDRVEAIDTIEEATLRGADLTRSLLSFGRRGRQDAGVVSLQHALAGVEPILRRAVGDHLDIEVSSEGVDAGVQIDAGELQLVLLNLALNAKDARRGERGQLKVRAREVHLDANSPDRPPELEPGDYAVLDVSDAGHGMSGEVLSHLFEAFFTTKRDYGTGLGLATCHRILREAGGAISVVSELGVGSTFSLYLPKTNTSTSRASRRVARSAVGGTERILLLEDERVLRMMAARFLQERGYTVLVGSSLEDLQGIAAEQLQDVRLIVTDYRLAKQSGLDAAATLLDRCGPVPVLVVSGYLDSPAQDIVRERGWSFLAKPFTLDGLARRVRESLDEAATQTA